MYLDLGAVTNLSSYPIFMNITPSRQLRPL